MDKLIKKIVIPICIFIILLLGMAFFDYIPLKLFNIDINKFSQSMKIFYLMSCDIGYMIILFFIYKDTLIKDFKSFKKNLAKNIDTCFKYYFLGLIIMMISNVIISLFFTNATANNEDSVRELIKLYPTYMLFSVSINAPFVEELIFRKSIKDAVISYKNNIFTKYLYIFLSGFIFALLHVVSSTSAIDYLYIIPYLSLGIAFSSLYYRTDNIFSSMLMHFLHNTIAILLIFMAGV